MLNQDALQQLAQLKSTLRESRDLAQGIVRTTTKRFGFVKLDDGREAFIDPEQMLRVLPDDRVQVEVITTDKNQLEARLEKLIHSPLRRFVGRYVVKGAGHFVEPDMPMFTRWLFIPPQDRKNCTPGAFLFCEMSQHPFHNQGKAQVRVLRCIGKPEDVGIEGRYTVAKYELLSDWEPSALEQAQKIKQGHQQDLVREDLSHLPFITIDAETTKDMDDAIYVEKTTTGWQLVIAIADPTVHIALDSALEQAARARATTLYLPGLPLTMLPPELSHETYSLAEGQHRPALICRVAVNTDGAIADFHFGEAVICSHHKFSYQQVNDFLQGNEAAITASPQVREMLKALQNVAKARLDFRELHALVMEERPDYFFVLNDEKKLAAIEKRVRNLAHRLVEEAMLVTNICAGELFAKHPGYGIFSSHVGFRPERLEEVLSLIREDKPNYDGGDLTRLENFQRLLRTLRLNLDQDAKNSALLSVLQRMLQAGALSAQAQPHFGLGFAHYATVTSPIRRYQDFYNHYALKALLRHQAAPAHPEDLLEPLQTQLNLGRTACRYLELWLTCDFAANHIGSVHPGVISQVNAGGIGVRLDDWGVEGFVLLADKDAGVKPSFDARRLSLTLDDKTFRLDEKVYVMISAVDTQKRRISLTLVDDATAARLSVWSQA